MKSNLFRLAVMLAAAVGFGPGLHTAKPVVISGSSAADNLFRPPLPAGRGYIQRQIRKRLRRRRALGIQTPKGTRLVSPR